MPQMLKGGITVVVALEATLSDTTARVGARAQTLLEADVGPVGRATD